MQILVTSKHGFLATVGTNAQAGDEISVLRAASVPLLLRKSKNRPYMETYKHIGTAYIHGIMDGEAWEQLDKVLSKLYKLI